MYKVLVVIVGVVITLSACGTNNEETQSLIAEKDHVIAELQVTLAEINETYEDNLEAKENEIIKLQTELTKANRKYEDKTIESSSHIEVMENSMIELEEKLSAVRERASHQSNYNMITGYHNGRLGMGYNPDYVSLYNNLMIIGYGEFELMKHEIVDLSADNIATITIDIAGELYNFRLGYIDWDAEYKEFTMTDLVYSADIIANTTLLFNSVLAEGIPGEAFMWTDETGKEFSYLIGDNSLRGDTFPYIIISELLE